MEETMSDYIFECCWKPEIEGQDCKYRAMARISDKANRSRIGIVLCTKPNDCRHQERVKIQKYNLPI